MILADALRALGQIGDPRFSKVLAQGIGLTLALLAALYAGVFYLVGWAVPDSFTLPWIGQIGWVDSLASGASLILMMALSVFLMVPVASAFISLFLDEVADAVEEKHYPRLPQAPRLPFAEALRDAGGFLVVIVLANLAALVLYLVLVPAAPLIFLGLNGFLLGREYFQLVAARRLGRAGARQLRRKHAAQIWAAGILMALPLTIPLLNLVVPVLGAATFTHLYHRVARSTQTTPR